MSSMSRACSDRMFLSSQAAKLIWSHSAALRACHGACFGIDRHICRILINPTPRFIVAHGLTVHGIAPSYRCCLPPTIIIDSPSMYCL